MGQACCQQRPGAPPDGKAPVQTIAQDVPDHHGEHSAIAASLLANSAQKGAKSASSSAPPNVDTPAKCLNTSSSAVADAACGAVVVATQGIATRSLSGSTPAAVTLRADEQEMPLSPQQRHHAITTGAEKPPPPPPTTNQDANGSAVTALRQPNRKRTLRTLRGDGSVTASALDVSCTTLRSAAAFGGRGSPQAAFGPAAQWATLPVVAQDFTPTHTPQVQQTLPAAAGHAVCSRDRAGTATSNGLVRNTFADGGGDQSERDTLPTPKTSSDWKSERNRWDDAMLLEELQEHAPGAWR
mmetsp:Transcript_67465/g.170183  ORF Transcript_67465/g.170183 Transcript_67465/m.170183 type:complete len:298 (+) Transcript_67465:122-1015(+)